MTDPLKLFDYIFVDNHVPKTLVLLHGTGGTKTDFLFLDDLLHHSYNLLGLQGNVNEQGMARFFRRFGMGNFDQENIKEETQKLYQFITAWSEKTKTDPATYTFLGYSNGANMILAMNFYFPTHITSALFLHPMLPIDPQQFVADFSNLRAFVSLGIQDQMIPYTESRRVVDILKQNNADVMVHEYSGGHELNSQELEDIVAFLQK